MDNVSRVIVSLIKAIFNLSITSQEFSIGIPIRYIALSLTFETAVINCGLPYFINENDINDIDRIRQERVTEWICNAERLLITTGLNYGHEDGCGIRIFQNDNLVLHEKSLEDEFGVNSNPILNEFIYNSGKWKEIEKDNMAIFQEIEAIFSLKRNGFLSTFIIAIVLFTFFILLYAF